MDEVVQLIRKIGKLKDIHVEIDVFELSKHQWGIRRKRKKLSDFSFDDLEKSAEFFKGRKRRIILEFIGFLKRNGRIPSKSSYVNVIFHFADFEKINEIIKRSRMSFRSFIIRKLCEEFSVKDFEPRSCVSHKSEVRSNQVLIPQELFTKIWGILERSERRKLSGSIVRKIISKKIDEILRKL